MTMAIGPYKRDAANATGGQITATPRSTLRRIGIRVLNVRGATGVRGRRR
jgi:hypothetical protein